MSKVRGFIDFMCVSRCRGVLRISWLARLSFKRLSPFLVFFSFFFFFLCMSRLELVNACAMLACFVTSLQKKKKNYIYMFIFKNNTTTMKTPTYRFLRLRSVLC